ncbi:MAG: hypothetical protein ACYC1Z_03145 [Georgenia sp.]
MARAEVSASPGARHRAGARRRTSGILAPARRSRSRRSGGRSVLAILGLALLTVVVAPSGTTMARWQDSATLALSTIQADSPGITVTGKPDGTFTVTNTSARTLLDWSVASLSFDVRGAEGRALDHGGPGKGWDHKNSLIKVSAMGAGGDCTREIAKGHAGLDEATEFISSQSSPLSAGASAKVCIEVMNGSLDRWMADHDVTVTLSVAADSHPAGWTAAGSGVASYGVTGGDEEPSSSDDESTGNDRDEPSGHEQTGEDADREARAAAAVPGALAADTTTTGVADPTPTPTADPTPSLAAEAPAAPATDVAPDVAPATTRSGDRTAAAENRASDATETFSTADNTEVPGAQADESGVVTDEKVTTPAAGR